MRIFGVIALVLGVLSLLLAVFVLVGNRDLQVPGPSGLDPLVAPFGWRAVLGIHLWTAAVWLTVGWAALRRLPGLAWLALLIYVVLFVPYLVLGGFLPSAIAVATIIVVLGVIVPVVVSIVATAIGGAVLRRRAGVSAAA
jgi:hypothetical protein